MIRTAFTLSALILASCATPKPKTDTASPAVADLMDEKGEKVGSALLTQASSGVRIVIDFQKLPPGEHALHIHNTGQCHVGDGGAKAFASAGPHFNPFGKKHGTGNPEGHHAGDLPNFTIGADGTAHVDIVADLVTLEEGKPNSLYQAGGTCLVVHAKADDNVTDPAGNAGQRMACGEIRKR